MTAKNRVEAVVFASGKKLSEDDIAKLCHLSLDDTRHELATLKKEYDTRESALMLIEESDGWKLTVREKYSPIIRNIVAETELSRTVMETLGVIAWKYPALQCDVIKIRTNKAYDHLDQLEELGYIAREKYGRTKKIRLTEKFFNYFDLPKHKESFKKIIPAAVREKVEAAESEISAHETAIEEDKIHRDLKKNKQQQIEVYGKDPVVEIVENASTKSAVVTDSVEFDTKSEAKEVDVYNQPQDESVLP